MHFLVLGHDSNGGFKGFVSIEPRSEKIVVFGGSSHVSSKEIAILQGAWVRRLTIEGVALDATPLQDGIALVLAARLASSSE